MRVQRLPGGYEEGTKATGSLQRDHRGYRDARIEYYRGCREATRRL